jgi:lycopene cyclase domain-containing protein
MSTYLLINLLTIAIPLLLTFEKRVSFYKKLKWLVPAILISGGVFIVWDHFFTVHGIWSFNPEHLSGLYIFDLPIEEWLFFFTVPYACVFIYESLNHYWPKDILRPYAGILFWILIVTFAALAVLNPDKAYTSVNAWFAIAVSFIHFLWFGYRRFGLFLRTYFTCLIPFLLVNGALTFLPVVIYNNAENLGSRIVSIPVEDTIYAYSLLLLTISLFERFQFLWRKRQLQYGLAA